MKSSPVSQPIVDIVDIKSTEKWEIYRRLQELGIPCSCATNQPLQIEVDNPLAIVQLVYVFRQLTVSRYELVDYLNSCWQIDSRQVEINNFS